jgi:tellurite resistance protein TehA-like permease
LNAILVAGLVLYVSWRALSKHSDIPYLRRPVIWMLLLLTTQLLLGVGAYLLRVVEGINEVQPTLGLVIITVAHLGVGALILALAVVLTIQTYRHREPAAVLPFARGREVATA